MNPFDAILNLLSEEHQALAARWADTDNPLTDAELAELEAAAQALVELPDDEIDLVTLEAAVSAVMAVRTEADARLEAATAEQERRAALREQLATEPAAETPEEPAEEDEPAEEEPADDAPTEEAPATEADRAAEPVAAAARPRPSFAAVARHRPSRHDPAPRREEAPGSRVELTGINGERLSTMDDVVDQFVEARRRQGSVRSGYTENVPVVHRTNLYDEDRTITADGAVNQQRIATLSRNLFGADTERYEAVTAAGGLCAPLQPLYDIPGFSTDARPVQAGLQRLGGGQAARGGFTYRQPFGINSADAVYGDGVAQWTVANDTTPSDPATKPCFEVPCGDTVDAIMYAVTRCLTFHNIAARTDPETMRSVVEETNAVYAREAETLLLDAMKAASKAVSPTGVLGASSELIYHWDLAAIGLRSRERVSPNAVVEITVPWWVRSMIRNDRMRRIPGDGGNPFALADAWIDEAMRVRNLRFGIEYLDSPSTGTSQILPAQGTGQELVDYPGDVQWGAALAGSDFYIDGGELDLGTVRDSTLISTNEFKTFYESFEGYAFRGIERIWGVSTVYPNGAVAATIDMSTSGDSSIYVP